tara:strand:+ start:303 stop:521 length:219 start_codon:yes stop_codon:yes gene_type:complete
MTRPKYTAPFPKANHVVLRTYDGKTTVALKADTYLIAAICAEYLSKQWVTTEFKATSDYKGEYDNALNPVHN